MNTLYFQVQIGDVIGNHAVSSSMNVGTAYAGGSATTHPHTLVTRMFDKVLEDANNTVKEAKQNSGRKEAMGAHVLENMAKQTHVSE